MSDQKPQGPDLAAGVAMSALASGAPIAGVFRGKSVMLVEHRGGYCALANACTHLGAPLAEGLVVDGQVRCPWHHARFLLDSGEAIAAPAFDPLTRYAVEECDGRVYVTGELDAGPPPAPATVPPAHIVIVGGGAAGHACAEMLARSGFGRQVALVSDDADPPYDRTFCSKQYLFGAKSRDECLLPLPAHGALHLKIDAKVHAIDVGGRAVILDDGVRVAFDVLVLATGAEPERPSLDGFDRPNVHVLRTLRDADALIVASGRGQRRGKRAVVVGASFIGLEVAASLTQRRVKVHVVAPDDVPLKKIVGADVGAMIRGVHEAKGVRFHLGREAKAFDGKILTLDDGSTIAADFVVVGTGVKPRTGLAKDAGLALADEDDGGGVIVDEHLETSLPGIYAIGDIARYPDVRAGAPIRVEHWVHAQRQGQFVARRLMGATGRFDDLPFFWSAHFDTGLRYLGHVATIVGQDVDGSIAEKDFTIRYAGAAGQAAFTSCNRDLPALDVEAEWEARQDVGGAMRDP